MIRNYDPYHRLLEFETKSGKKVFIGASFLIFVYGMAISIPKAISDYMVRVK